jgi:hypothetical protein
MTWKESRADRLRVYIGYDEREKVAYDVAEKTAKAWGCDVIPLYEERLRYHGLLTRPTDRRGGLFDLNSNAPMSTEFAISRFFVPVLAHAGWCLFADSDVVFTEDPLELMAFADPDKALHCVKHDAFNADGTKMRGQSQTSYARKCWSSVILWNCDHPSNKRLNLSLLNQWPGRDLHGLKWLADSEIGELPSEANWLVGIQPKPERPIVCHFTLGTPDMPERRPTEHDDIWWRHAA